MTIASIGFTLDKTRFRRIKNPALSSRLMLLLRHTIVERYTVSCWEMNHHGSKKLRRLSLKNLRGLYPQSVPGGGYLSV
jgi:hypothetical protein